MGRAGTYDLYLFSLAGFVGAVPQRLTFNENATVGVKAVQRLPARYVQSHHTFR